MRIRLAAALLLTLVFPSAAQESCTTAGRFKTCVVTNAYGTRTTVTDLHSAQRAGGKVQNIESTQIAFNDVGKLRTGNDGKFYDACPAILNSGAAGGYIG
jgi:hypothetical protein